jgi:hypothetical protein
MGRTNLDLSDVRVDGRCHDRRSGSDEDSSGNELGFGEHDGVD